MADLLSAALDYAAAGVYVFPARVDVIDGRKRVSPVAKWREASTRTADVIRDWFGHDGAWRDASLCIDCGKSELVVVDLDVTGGHDGITAWGALMAQHEIEPTPVRSHTPSGGEHWFYREHFGHAVGNDASGKVAPGVDVRGLGGFVIAWPSEDARGAYGEILPADLTTVPVVPSLVIERMTRREAGPPIYMIEGYATGRPASVWDTMPRQFTRAEAVEFCRPVFAALRSARVGEINHRLNDAAIIIGHFVPALWTREKATAILLDALADTAYDARTWKAEPTIASGLGADTWRAEILAERGVQETVSESSAMRALTAVSADTMTMRAPRWLYDWRIPMNAITLLAGREGIGKSTIAYDVAARVTRGTLTGRHKGSAKGVAVVAGEDSWEHVIVPRLVAAGADLRRVYRVEATQDGHTDVVSVPSDLTRLRALCTAKDVALVILDPLMSVINGALDTHKDREVRQALDPLSRFAAESDIAVVGLIHVNKTATTDPLTSIMASRAFAAVARSVLYGMADPQADGDERYVLGHAKSNLGPKQPTLNYHLTEYRIQLDDQDEPVVVTSRVVWDGEDVRSIRDVMETVRAQPVGELATELLAWITEQGRTVSSVELASEFSDVKRPTLDKNLQRMVDRGTLYRPTRGHFAITVRGQSDTVSDTLSGDSKVSEEEEVLTLLTDVTSDTPPREVSEVCCKGNAPTVACQLCTASPTYWKRAQ